MRILIAILYTLSFISSSIAYGNSCRQIFEEKQPILLLPAPARKIPIIIEPVKSNSDRVELKRYENTEAAEKLVIEEKGFSSKPEEASIEMMRLLLQNSSYVLEEKNVLTKGELSIGIPAKDGYFFEVTYKSMSTEKSQFIVDKITLRTPTGAGSKKVAEGFLNADEVKIKKAEHELGDILGAGINAKIKIPLIIDGPLLAKIDKLAKFFEYFKKDELRNLLRTNSMTKIRLVFEYRRARDVFFKVLFKEPIKAAIGMGFIILATGMTTNSFQMMGSQPEPIATHIVAMAPRETSSYLHERINNIVIPPAATAIRAEVAQLNAQVKTHFQSTEVYNGPRMSEIRLDQNNAFSQQHQTWIFEKLDPVNQSTHTYIVFAEEKASVSGPGIQYMVMEINASKYPELIKFIKNQGKIPTAHVEVK
ncbi:MAG: hypothetical protein V4654_12790 [Bdellovibrionota bacterium]